MKVAIHQPSYAPWCGYFAKIWYADAFIFLDDAQMTKNNLVNRNRICLHGKEQWITVPVRFSLGDPICATGLADPQWPARHRGQLEQCYRRAPHFREVAEMFDGVYSLEHANLAELNICMTKAILGYLGLERPLYRASELQCPGKADDRLVRLVLRVGGETYVSGPGGMHYQDPAKFSRAGLRLEVKAYSPIPYPQASPTFIPNLSILDALFNLGLGAASLLRYMSDDER